MRKLLVSFTALAMAAVMVTPAAATGGGVSTETEDVLDQMHPVTGERDVYAADAATLRRTPNGISVKIQMPTPEPDTYQYPTEGAAFSGPGHPEAFTLWVFVFDDELGPFGNNPWSSVFVGAGHVVGGPNLTLSGHVSTSTEPFAGFDLQHPGDVDVHLAVAPHGALDAELMPAQITTPTGPGPDIWWVALFDSAG